MKKICFILSFFALLGVSQAYNQFHGPNTVSQVLILQTGGNPVCQVQLSDATFWAFEIDNASQEKNVDLLRTAMEKGYDVYANYYGTGGVDQTLTYAPTGGSSQVVTKANGWAVTP
jgi:hypothetical protein